MRGSRGKKVVPEVGHKIHAATATVFLRYEDTRSHSQRSNLPGRSFSFVMFCLQFSTILFVKIFSSLRTSHLHLSRTKWPVQGKEKKDLLSLLQPQRLGMSFCRYKPLPWVFNVPLVLSEAVRTWFALRHWSGTEAAR